MRTQAILLIGGTALLAACDGDEPDNVPEQPQTEIASGSFTDPDSGRNIDYALTASEDGNTVTMTTGEGDATVKISADAANDLPNDVPLYPGAVADGGFHGSAEAGQSTMVSFATKDAPEDVIAFYKQLAERQDMEVTEVNAGGSRTLGAEAEDKSRGFQIIAQPGEDGSGTKGMLVAERR